MSPTRILTLVLLAGGDRRGRAIARPSPGPSAAELEQRLAAYRHLLADWAGLTRYGSDNSEVRPPAAGEQRVVFIGDQITESWRLAEFFPGKPYLNRGIDGQTSPQMLVRFRQDVIGLEAEGRRHPDRHERRRRLHRAGDPGHAGGSPHVDDRPGAGRTASAWCSHRSRRSATARTVTSWRGRRRICGRSAASPTGTSGSREHAAGSGSVYLDYYSALASGRNFKPELTVDGVLPNDAGYKVMAALAEQAIAQALGSTRPG